MFRLSVESVHLDLTKYTTQCIGLVYATGVGEFGMPPPTGTVGGSYGNAMAGGADGACRTELVWRREPFRDLRGLGLATFRWVS